MQKLEIVQADLFNVAAGRALRDAGMQHAAEHADKVLDHWQESAFQILKDYGPRHGQFRMEQVRQYAETVWKLEPPPDCRAWGAIARRAQREGFMQSAGIVKSTTPEHHRSFKTQWIWRV